MIFRSGQDGIEVFPGLDGRTGLPERLELVDGERLDEGILGVDHQSDAIVADEEPRPLDPLGLGLGFLVLLGRSRGVHDVHLALEITAEAAAGPMVVHHHGDVGIDRLESFLSGLADPEDRARPVHNDRPALLAAPPVFPGPRRWPSGPIRNPPGRRPRGPVRSSR